MTLFAAQERRVRVLLPLPLADAYDYICPPGLELQPGDFVRVPLSNRERTGVVWEIAPEDSDLASDKLKAVLEKIDQPPVPTVSIDFINWVARYTLQPKGAVLKMLMSVPKALENPKPKTAYVAASPIPDGLKLSGARRRVLDFMADMMPMAASDIAREAGVSPSVIKGLADIGGLEKVYLHNSSPFAEPDWKRSGHTLSDAQATGANALSDKIDQGFAISLLDGVPGSGKTEVYFEAVAKALSLDQQILVMLPEIALSSQWLKRFKDRFGVEPAVWHSDISQTRRKDTWRAIIRGQAKVVVGARSALFLPYQNLGLIIVDEEHDTSFKQEEGVIYNARDMAVVRAQLGKCPIVLASATPSLETMVNAWDGKYDLLHLPSRHGDVSMPAIETVDLRLDKPARQQWVSPTLQKRIAETLERQEQVLLYLNRRGYAPLTLCRACGHRLQCPQCTSWLVEHRHAGKLQCHHCGYATRMPKTCPSCEAEDQFAACGPGVERLAEEIALHLPDARVRVATSDTLNTATQAAELVRAIEQHEVDILIGTQMMAKGYHFPLLTLVGVVDGDLGLSGGDLRASERTYQLLYQVAGRAGRAEKPGRVVIQTHMPDHPVMKALKSAERDRFLSAESEARQTAAMPPFGRLSALIVSGEDEAMVDDVSFRLGQTAPRGQGIQAFGPAPAPISMIRGRFRRRLLLKTQKNISPQKLIRAWLEQTKIPAKIRLQVDIDPYSFL